MDIVDALFHFTAEAQVLRNSPRTGGRTNLGVAASIPLDVDFAYKTQATLVSPGDSIVIDLASGEIVTTTAIGGMTIGGAFTATLPPAGMSNGKQTYATGAEWASTAGRTMDRVRWISSQWQIDRYAAGVLTHRYVSSSAVATPNLATGWTQTVGTTTAAPTVTPAARTISYIGGDGRDLNGLTLPAPSGLSLIALVATSVDAYGAPRLNVGLTAAHTALTPSGSSHQVWIDIGGITDALTHNLTLTAVNPNTTVALLAYGNL
jgi:hypothetical protein